MPKPDVSEQRRNQIIEAAATVFNERGLTIARMEDVALAAGLSKGTLYLYFISKDALIEALLHRVFEPLDAALNQLLAGNDPVYERIQMYALDNLQAFAQFTALYPLLLELFALARRQTYAGNLFTVYYTRYLSHLTTLIEDGIHNGELRSSLDADKAAIAFLTTIDGILMMAMLQPEFMRPLIEGRHLMNELVGGWR